MSHIYVKRKGGYTHHGILVDESEVIHFNGKIGRKEVKQTSLQDFLGNSDKFHVREHDDSLHQHTEHEIIARARDQVGSSSWEYDLLSNNCEHFATWCVTGDGFSYQVHRWTWRHLWKSKIRVIICFLLPEQLVLIAIILSSSVERGILHSYLSHVADGVDDYFFPRGAWFSVLGLYIDLILAMCCEGVLGVWTFVKLFLSWSYEDWRQRVLNAQNNSNISKTYCCSKKGMNSGHAACPILAS